MQTTGKAVSVPGRAIGPLLGLLKPQVGEAQHAMLLKYHDGVVASLKGEGSGELAESLAQLKALASNIEAE